MTKNNTPPKQSFFPCNMSAGSCLLALVFGFLSLNAQQTSIHGWISIHNSGYREGTIEFVPDAYLTAPLASPTRTDDKGQFKLIFSGVPKNSRIEIEVEKSGFLVVNHRELKDITAGRSRPLHIFLATPEQLDRERLALERVSLEALTRHRDSLIAGLREAGQKRAQIIQELEREIGATIANRFAAEEKLREQFEKVKTQVPALAAKLARVNLDFASDLKIKAFNLFKAGKIDSVTIVLEAANLDSISKSLVGQFQTNQQVQMSLDSGMAISQMSIDTLIAAFALAVETYLKQDHLDSALVTIRQQLHFQSKVQPSNHGATHWQLAHLHQKLFHARNFSSHPYPEFLAPTQYRHLDSARFHFKAAIAREVKRANPDSLFLYNAYLKLAEDYFPESFSPTAGSLLRQEYNFFKLSPDSALTSLHQALLLHSKPRDADAHARNRCTNRIAELLEARCSQLLAKGKIDAAIETLESAMTFSQIEKQKRRIEKAIKILKRKLP